MKKINKTINPIILEYVKTGLIEVKDLEQLEIVKDVLDYMLKNGHDKTESKLFSKLMWHAMKLHDIATGKHIEETETEAEEVEEELTDHEKIKMGILVPKW